MSVVIWPVMAALGALFAAYLSWLHATQEVFVIAHDVRPVAIVCAIIAIALLGEAVRLAIRRAAPPVWERVLLAALAAVTLIVVPGRALQLRRTLRAFGNEDQRRVHNALRLLVTAQEDYRLASGRYSTSVSELESSLLAHVPAGISVSILRAKDSSLWAGTASDESMECRVLISSGAFSAAAAHRNFLDDEIVCGTSSGPRVDSFAPAPTLTSRRLRRVDSTSEWSQERGSADRRGIALAPPIAARWDTRVGGSLRAAAGIGYPYVIVGAHGTGWLGALDVESGAILWNTRAVNWIHQNPLISRGRVFVGLGDRARLLAGDAVGLGVQGVAAHDLATGRLLWFARTRGAVMTAPVVAGNQVISADGSGWLQAWSVDSGRALWSSRMPGYAVMASPALRDSTVFIALAHRHLCAYAVRGGRQLWCHEAPRAFRIGGDPTPSVIGGAVYWSLSYDSTGVEILFRGSSGRNYLRDKLLGNARAHSSQWLFAIDAQSGRERWRREIGGGFPARGNMAGTAIAYGDAVIVVAPRARRMAALDTATGAVRWSHELDSFSRGAVTVIDSVVVVADSARHLHLFRAKTGHAICTGTLPDTPDRAGPTVVGQTAIFTGLNGLVFARPLQDVLTCRTR